MTVVELQSASVGPVPKSEPYALNPKAVETAPAVGGFGIPQAGLLGPGILFFVFHRGSSSLAIHGSA